MSTVALDTQSSELTTSSVIAEESKATETAWEGRKWAFLGSKANIPMFTHRLFALTSAAFASLQWGLQIAGGSSLARLQGACGHAINLFEAPRRVVEYTNIINTAYRSTTEGPGFFIAKNKNAEGEDKVNWLQTAANTCFVAISIILPVDFIYSRISQGNIGESTDVGELQHFAKAGFNRTKIFDVFAATWLLGTGLSMAISGKKAFDGFYAALQKERSENKEQSHGASIWAAWNKGVTNEMLHDFKLKSVDFGFSCFAGGLIPFPAGALTKACGIAFKLMAGYNGITEICLGEKVKV